MTVAQLIKRLEKLVAKTDVTLNSDVFLRAEANETTLQTDSPIVKVCADLHVEDDGTEVHYVYVK